MSSAISDRLRGPGAAAGAVAAVMLALFAGPLATGERFYFRDISQNHGPILEGARRLLAAGDRLWWNPWSAGGEPLFANPNHLLATPLGWLALSLPRGPALSVALAISSILGPVMLVLLLGRLGCRGWSAAAGGIVLGLSGYWQSAATLPNLLAAASWIPCALYCMHRARDSAWWIPVAALASAFVVVPAEPASALVLAAFGVALCGWRSLAGLALGVCLAAVQWLPALSWIGASSRGAGLDAAEVTKWSLEWARLPEIVAPGFLGDPSRLDAWWSFGRFATGFPLMLSLYVGLPSLLLALLGLLSDPNAMTGARGAARRSALVGAGFLLISQGGIVGALARVSPLAAWFRYPEKFLLGPLLALAILAAFGFARLERELSERRQVVKLTVWIGAGAAMLLLGSVVAAPLVGAGWFAIPRSAGAILREAVQGVRWSFSLGAIGCLTSLAAVALAARGRSGARGPMLAAGLTATLLIGAVRLGSAGGAPWSIAANPSGPAGLLEAGPLFGERLDSLNRNGERLVRFERPAGFAGRRITGTMADLFWWERRSFERSSATAFGVPLAFDRTTDRVDPAGIAEATVFLQTHPAETSTRIWGLASVRDVLAYAPIASAALAPVARLEGESATPVLLYENRNLLPRARLASMVRAVSSDQDAFAAIAAAPDGVWQGMACLLIEGTLRTVGAHATSRPVRIVESRPGRIAIEVGRPSADGSGSSDPDVPGDARAIDWLIVSENDVPGWSASVNGKQAPIVRVNGMHIAIPLPDHGAQRVEIAYAPPGLGAGAALSGLGALLACVIAWAGAAGKA